MSTSVSSLSEIAGSYRRLCVTLGVFALATLGFSDTLWAQAAKPQDPGAPPGFNVQVDPANANFRLYTFQVFRPNEAAKNLKMRFKRITLAGGANGGWVYWLDAQGNQVSVDIDLIPVLGPGPNNGQLVYKWHEGQISFAKGTNWEYVYEVINMPAAPNVQILPANVNNRYRLPVAFN
jgi:hypothetical protein